jgi:hypothetical protein
VHVHRLAINFQGTAQFHLGPVHIRVARHDDEGALGQFWPEAQAIHHKFPSTSGKVQIQDNQIREFTPRHAHGNSSITCFQGFKAALPQDCGDPQAAVFVVLNNEYFFHGMRREEFKNRKSTWNDLALTIFTISDLSTPFFFFSNIKSCCSKKRDFHAESLDRPQVPHFAP